MTLCWIPLVPQGFVPLVMKLSGSIERAWFVRAYLPASYQWLMIAATLALGSSLLVIALRIRGVRLIL
jgi:ABC-2 type transport system permease protein